VVVNDPRIQDDLPTADGDADLDAFTRDVRAQRLRPIRIVLVAAVMLTVAAVVLSTWDEVAYAARGRLGALEPIDVADVTAVGADGLPLGAWVRARVVLGNRAARIEGWRRGSLRMGPIEVRQVLGAPLFVEYQEAEHPTWAPFREVDVEGRIVEMSGPDLDGVRAFIEREQGLSIPPEARVLVVGETPDRMGRYFSAWAAAIVAGLWALRSLRRVRRR
jgi:hypothetical protein